MQTRRALRYPLEGDNAEPAIVGGFVLGFLIAGAVGLGPVGVLLAVLPGLVFLGFLGRIVERSVDGDRSIPGFNPVRALPKRGLRLGVVVVGYAVPPALVTAWIGTVLTGMAADDIGTAGGYAFVAVSTGLVVVWGVFGYLLPAAIISVVRSGSVRSMVAFGSIRGVVGRESYLVAWIRVALLVGFTSSLAAIVISADRRAGLLAVPMVVYVLYASGHLLGASCEEDSLW